MIDSSHRQLTKPDGSLDIEHWIENSTREKIFADTLLPLAETMKWYYNSRKVEVIICTARMATQHDLDFLAAHGLHYDFIVYRDAGDMRGDAQYKSEKLAELALAQGWPSDWRGAAIMFDDNVAVIRQMILEGLHCVDAIAKNERLAA